MEKRMFWLKSLFVLIAMTGIGLVAPTVSPAAADEPEGCEDYCELMECSFGGEFCMSACYDGKSWTFCFQPE